MVKRFYAITFTNQLERINIKQTLHSLGVKDSISFDSNGLVDDSL